MKPGAAGSLRAFQDAFAARLEATYAAFDAHPGYAVYRNTGTRAALDALAANHPTVHRLVGDDWFEHAALVFVRRAPPHDGVLAGYGAGFADFLDGFEPARALPYLAEVARLDRAWTEAHLAADAPALGFEALAGLDLDALGRARLVPHPAARWLRSAAAPAFSIWARHREGRDLEADLPWHPEAALVARPRDVVRWCALGDEAWRCLEACAAGAPLGDALEAGGGDVAAWWPQLVDAGAFTALDRSPT
jgi:hypothetical protein